MTIRKPKRYLALLLSVLVAAELVVSVVMGTVADTPKKVTKQLLDFSNCEVKNNIDLSNWPKGLEQANYTVDQDTAFQYDENGFRIDIAKDGEEKYLRFSFNKTNSPGTVQNIKLRTNGAKIFLKASIPAKYIKYLKSIKLDYSYKYNKSGVASAKNLQSFYVFGVTDGTTFSTEVPSTYSTTNTVLHTVINKGSTTVNNSVEMNVTDLIKCTDVNARNFLGNVQNAKNLTKWTASDLETQGNLDVILMFSPPQIANTTADKNAGYFLGIKGISVDIEGPESEIDNIDQLPPLVPEIINFDDYTDIVDVKDNSTISFDATDNTVITTEEAYMGNSLSYKYKSGTETNPTSNFSFQLDGDQAVQSKGLSFVVKNISNKTRKVRVWFAPKNNTLETNKYGKYQYVFNLPANMTDYKTITIPWDNLGIMEFKDDAQIWNNSTYGYSITESELASGIGVSIRANVVETDKSITFDDAGILFDEFKYTTEKSEGETTTLIDFSNCNVGNVSRLNPLPNGVKINEPSFFDASFEKYSGTPEIVQNMDGTKSLALNYNNTADWLAGATNAHHHLYSRPYYMLSIEVPKGSMTDLSEIQFELTNNAARYNSDRNSEDSLHYNICVANSTLESSNRFGKTTEIDSQINFKGSSAVSVKMSEMFLTGTWGMASWSNKAAATFRYWTEEEYKDFDTVLLLISAPISETKDNGRILVNSVTLKYKDKPLYAESTRPIVTAEKPQEFSSGKINSEQLVIKAKDPNYAEFNTAYKINVTDATNTERIVYNDKFVEYVRNAYPFYNSETKKPQLQFFGHSAKDVKLAISLIDKNAAELIVEKTLPATTAELYNSISFDLGEEYDKAVAADKDFAFDLTDIRSIAILPIVDEPVSFNIAAVALYTDKYLMATENPEKIKNADIINLNDYAVGKIIDDTITPADDQNSTGKTQIPINVTFPAACYDGSREVVENPVDGTNSLRFNYDAIAEHKTDKDHHQNDTRTNIFMEFAIPKGSLVGVQTMVVNMTNNGFTRAEQNAGMVYDPDKKKMVDTSESKLKKCYVTLCAMNDENFFVKQSYNASEFTAEKGVADVRKLTFVNNPIVAQGSFPQSWCNPAKCIPMTDEIMASFNKIRIYISVPDLTEEDLVTAKANGWNFQINSIKLEYDATTLPHYGETESRTIINGDDSPLTSTNEDTLYIGSGSLPANHPDYYLFNKYSIVNAQEGNTASAVMENRYSCFWRDAKAFQNTAKFRMYYQTAKAQDIQLTVVNVKNEKLVYKTKLNASEGDEFDQLVVTLKTMFDSYKADNPDATFDFTDIRRFEILPLSGGTPINIADPDLWTIEPVDAPPPGIYHYETPDGDVRIDGYNHAIENNVVTDIEILDVQETLAENMTKLPDGAKALKVIRISMRNESGDLIDVDDKFWIGFKIPANSKIENLKIYELLFDGSIIAVKRVSVDPDNFLSFQDIFKTKTFAILEMADAVKEDSYYYIETENTNNTNNSYPGDYEVIGDDNGDGEIVETPTQETIVKRYKRKKKTNTADYTWLWILIVVVAVVVLVATGLVIFFIVRKKRKQKGDVTQ